MYEFISASLVWCVLSSLRERTYRPLRSAHLLRNPLLVLPPHLLPQSYNLDAYQGAVLYAPALHSAQECGLIDICHGCHRHISLHARMLVDALANFQYYAYDQLPVLVREAFEKASLFDIMLVARARASRAAVTFEIERPS